MFFWRSQPTHLKIFTAHVDESQGLHDPVFVREGFNWWAFLFTGVWLLVKGLWLGFLAFVLIDVAMYFMVRELDLSPAVAVVGRIAVQVWFGFEGNEFVRNKLERKGYVLQDIVASDSEASAELRFFDRHAELLDAKTV